MAVFSSSCGASRRAAPLLSSSFSSGGPFSFVFSRGEAAFSAGYTDTLRGDGSDNPSLAGLRSDRLGRGVGHALRIPLQESSADQNCLNVYTFGGHDDFGWRRHPDHFSHQGVCRARSPPALIDGKLFVVTKQTWFTPRAEKLLVIDVASEAYCTYALPEYEAFNAEAIEVFELDRQPCVAMNADGRLCLWVMPMPQFVQGGRQQLENTLHGEWVRSYILVYRNNRPVLFSVDDEPSGIWVDGNGQVQHHRQQQ